MSLYVKEVNFEDLEKEYEAFKGMPINENGFYNPFSNFNRVEFKKEIERLINESKGINLKEGRVPQTVFMLWEDDEIIGVFKVRHYLNDFLREGSGHIGFSILKEHRGKGYATKGLALILDKAKDLIKEDEVYLKAYNYNNASIKAQLNNGAYIAKKDDENTYLRIKKSNAV